MHATLSIYNIEKPLPCVLLECLEESSTLLILPSAELLFELWLEPRIKSFEPWHTAVSLVLRDGDWAIIGVKVSGFWFLSLFWWLVKTQAPPQTPLLLFPLFVTQLELETTLFLRKQSMLSPKTAWTWLLLLFELLPEHVQSLWVLFLFLPPSSKHTFSLSSLSSVSGISERSLVLSSWRFRRWSPPRLSSWWHRPYWINWLSLTWDWRCESYNTFSSSLLYSTPTWPTRCGCPGSVWISWQTTSTSSKGQVCLLCRVECIVIPWRCTTLKKQELLLDVDQVVSYNLGNSVSNAFFLRESGLWL